MTLLLLVISSRVGVGRIGVTIVPAGVQCGHFLRWLAISRLTRKTWASAWRSLLGRTGMEKSLPPEESMRPYDGRALNTSALYRSDAGSAPCVVWCG
jgi:hypothetical protein